nr:hypothetical protein [Tanacetum cinerariifolium]
FSFLKTLPVGQVRNGFAELVKIASVGDKFVWDLLVKHGKELVETGFGFKEGGEDVKEPGKQICHQGIDTMLEVSRQTPYLSVHTNSLARITKLARAWS